MNNNKRKKQAHYKITQPVNNAAHAHGSCHIHGREHLRNNQPGDRPEADLKECHEGHGKEQGDRRGNKAIKR